MDLLILLVERRGQLVTRADIVARLWGPDVFVDVEMGVNTAISKVRQALRDTPDAPRFLETVSGKGYRFIAPVDGTPPAEPPAGAACHSLPSSTSRRPRRSRSPPAGSTKAAGHRGRRWSPCWRDRGRRPGRVARPRHRATGRVALAVLPFVNLDKDVERDYLAAGLTDDTSASLARIDPAHLTVKGRTQPYRGTTKTAAQIGQELSVDYLVESSIRAEGSRVRVTVSLLRVRDQAHVWSQLFDREATSLLSLQQELSAAIAEQVRLTLSPERLRGVQTRQTGNASAYDAYLRGRYQRHRRTADGNRQAVALFRQADRPRPDLCPGLVRLVGRLRGQHDQRRCAPGRGRRAGAGGGTAGGGDRPVVAGSPDGARIRALAARLGLARGRNRPSSSGRARSEQWHRTSHPRARALAAWPAGGGDGLHGARAGIEPVGFRHLGALGPGRLPGARHGGGGDLCPPRHRSSILSCGSATSSSDRPTLPPASPIWRWRPSPTASASRNGNSKVASMRGYVLARMGRTAAAREVVEALTHPSPARYVPPYAAALVYAGLGDREATFARARTGLRRPRRPPDVPAGGPEVGSVPHRPALRRPARPLRVPTGSRDARLTVRRHRERAGRRPSRSRTSRRAGAAAPASPGP